MSKTATTQAQPIITHAITAFAETLVAKSPHTSTNYQSALNRFCEFIKSIGYDPDARATFELPADVLERFYTWLLRKHGRERRNTAVTYVGEVRSFFRFLDRRSWLGPNISYEHIKDGLRELIGKVPYKTPRVDDAVALVVLYVQQLELPANADASSRIALLRDRAVLTTLYATAMRRHEISRLNRTDIQDGRASQGLITGKGDKERVVFFDDDSLAAIRAYLAARADTHIPLFIRHDDGRGRPGRRGERWRLSPQSIWAIVKKYGALAGVEVTTHHLRHLKARVMLNRGAQLSEVQDILGHSSPETTKKIYAPYTTQHLRDAFDRFSASPQEVAGRAGARQSPSQPNDDGTTGRKKPASESQ